MTHDDAIAAAMTAAARTGEPHVVYRFPSWPAGVFSIVPQARLLPMEAQTFEVLGRPAPPQGALF